MKNQGPWTDAYAHVGEPRFGAARLLWRVLEGAGIQRAVFVLGPGVPDLAALVEIGGICGDLARTVTIPWGGSVSERGEFLDASWEAGAIGVRLMPGELRSFGEVTEEVGRRSGWLFAIDAHRAADTSRCLLDWLERHPGGRIASPHFLEARAMGQACADAPLVRELVGHPRFHAILSRHGGVGGAAPYPHPDLRPWLDEILPLLGRDRVAWGSEAPVLFWRDESLESARNWLGAVLGSAEGPVQAAFLGENARRWFFGSPAERKPRLRVPAWCATLPEAPPVRLFGPRGWPVPATEYQRWMRAYLPALADRAGLTFGDFLAEMIERGLGARRTGDAREEALGRS
jgi:hypothetical protein